MTCANTPEQQGVFISFEGGEGAGKTTHINFLASQLEKRGREVVRLREPGGTAIGEKLRSIVLDPGNAAMSDACELLIYEAARAQIVHEVVKPALERGAVVLCDRFFDSTTAYQGYGRGLDADFVRRANAFACQGLCPHRTILLVAPSAEVGLQRATEFASPDRLESAGEAFHNRVRKGFDEIAGQNSQRIRVIHTAQTRSATARAIFAELRDLLDFAGDMIDENDAAFGELDACVAAAKATFTPVPSEGSRA